MIVPEPSFWYLRKGRSFLDSSFGVDLTAYGDVSIEEAKVASRPKSPGEIPRNLCTLWRHSARLYGCGKACDNRPSSDIFP